MPAFPNCCATLTIASVEIKCISENKTNFWVVKGMENGACLSQKQQAETGSGPGAVVYSILEPHGKSLSSQVFELFGREH